MRILPALVLLALAATTTAEDRRPNIVAIVADDLGRDWLSCYGAEHRTPHLDRLAEQGVRYETAWSTSQGPASFASLLTGRYPCWRGATKEADGAALDPERTSTFVQRLHEAGYATALGGRWPFDDLGRAPRALQRHGFDQICVEVASDRPDVRRTVEVNGKRKTVENAPHTISDTLIAFIEKERDEPFIVLYTMSLPVVSEDSPDGRASFAAGVTRIDSLVGRLLVAIDESEHRDDTLVLFTSENGSAVAGTLSGETYPRGKGAPADHGVHVPFLVRAPFLTAGDRVSGDLVDLSDVFPTLMQLAGTPMPEGLVIDGKSFVPSLRGSEDPFEKRNWIHAQVGTLRMVRDWQHVLDSEGGFHDLTKDPLQRSEVSPLDKIAPGRRQRLEMLLRRLPDNPEKVEGS